MERKPSGNTKYRSIGESIILGAASAALTGDRNRPNIPQLVKHPSQLQHSVWILIFNPFSPNISSKNYLKLKVRKFRKELWCLHSKKWWNQRNIDTFFK